MASGSTQLGRGVLFEPRCSHLRVSGHRTGSRPPQPWHRQKAISRLRPIRCCAPQQSSKSQQDQGLPKSLLGGLAIGFGAAAFVGLRLLSGAPTFENLERASIPLDTALQNGKPTVIEFYASWCNICRELLPDTLEVHLFPCSNGCYLGLLH